MSKPTLGFAMIMQDDSIHIPIAIAQFYHVVDDIVVVDGGSSDDSIQWAEKMGARVLHRPFDNDFSTQKNFAIESLETDWVYLHDTDERLEPALLEILPMLISAEGQEVLMQKDIIPLNEENFDCFGIPRKNYIDGVRTSIYPDYQYRLFRRHCRFEGLVYETIANFDNRTELDYRRVDSQDFDQCPRFNILHYKSGVQQKSQDQLYRMINGER